MKLHHSPATGRFWAECSYEERGIPKQAGFRWDPTARCWYSTDPMAAAKLATYADDAAKAALAAASLIAESSTVSDPSALPPALAEKKDHLLALFAPDAPTPYPYQIAGSLLMLATLERQQGVMLGDDMGLGKTLQSLLVAGWLLREARNRRIIVCCPTAVGPSWVREAKKWLGLDAYLHKGTKVKQPLPTTGLVIVPYSVAGSAEVAQAVMAAPIDLLICDELHYLKNPKAIRTVAVWDTFAKVAKRVIAMSGTPVPNRPREICHIVCRMTSAFGNEWYYLNKYCDPQKVWTGRKTVTTFDGATNLEDLAQRLRTSGVLIRRMKTEVLKELPKKRRDIVVLGDKAKAERRLIDSGIDVAEIRAQLAAADAPDFTECSLLRHADALERVEDTASYIADALEECAEPAVIFAHHKDVVWGLHAALQKLGIDAVVATGEMDAAARQAAVDAFAAGTGRAFIGTIASCGTGLNGLQTRATRVYMAESSWTPGDNEQAEDRVCRIGAVARDGIQCVYLVSDGGVDSYVLDVVLQKGENIQTIMAAANGITDAEQLIVPEEIVRRQMAAIAIKAVIAPPVSRDDKAILHRACQTLDERNDDHATVENEIGYNKLDGAFGHSLAQAPYLTDKQAHAAAKMLRKYKNTQVPFARDAIERVLALSIPHPSPQI
jgi:SWI/SNF-related matrix-associated actin-dependent regulator 1 of chromatin subfamily A